MSSIPKIIKSPRDSDEDLLRLASAMGVQVDQIDFKQYLDTSRDYSILNMGTPEIGGTHWVAVSNKDKVYFDPLGLPKPRVIPVNYKQYGIRVQDHRFGHCGDYSVFFLYCLQHGKLPQFDQMFRHLPKLI
ncbi:TPA_asm: adenain [Phytophthora water mold MELD virus]|nr:TPA_asm: adenain [Phytophthora water mold MELD virus]